MPDNAMPIQCSSSGDPEQVLSYQLDDHDARHARPYKRKRKDFHPRNTDLPYEMIATTTVPPLRQTMSQPIAPSKARAELLMNYNLAPGLHSISYQDDEKKLAKRRKKVLNKRQRQQGRSPPRTPQKEVIPAPIPQGESHLALHSPARTPTRTRMRSGLLSGSPMGRNLLSAFQGLHVEVHTPKPEMESNQQIHGEMTPTQHERKIGGISQDVFGGDLSAMGNEDVEPFETFSGQAAGLMPSINAQPMERTTKDMFQNSLLQTNPTLLSSPIHRFVQHSKEYFPILQAQHAPQTDSLECSSENKDLCTKDADTFYMCTDCFFRKWYCKDCIVRRHEDNPFHEIMRGKNGLQVMAEDSLYDLGLTVKLRHHDGTECLTIVPSKAREIKVLHSNGMHRLAYWQCLCFHSHHNRKALPTQLMAHGLFPATHDEPRTAFTFDTLKLFDVMNLESAINIKQFCDSLNHLTKHALKVNFDEATSTLRKDFHYNVRLWRLFKAMLERGVDEYHELLKEGAVDDCALCPHPGKNLREGWQNEKDGELLYLVIISGDGNFHLHSFKRTAGLHIDPSMFGDSAFFVPDELARKYIEAAEKITPKKEDSGSCETQAGTAARERCNNNFSIAGIWISMCDHGMYRYHGTVDLIKGERYSYVDVPFQIALQTEFEKGIPRVAFMYDIACKFSVNAHKRCVENPYSPLVEAYRERLLRGNPYFKPLVNGWHIHSHLPECSDLFGASYCPLMGHRPCEEIESTWTLTNRHQWTTREMDAGARRDQITACLLHMNKQKFNRMPRRTLEHLDDAEKRVEELEEELEALEYSLNQYDLSLLPRYKHIFQTKGGEQFRPDPKRVKYPTRAEAYVRLVHIERDIRGGQKHRNVLLQLAEQGIDLDSKWEIMRKQPLSTKNYTKKAHLEKQVDEFRRNLLEQFPYLSEEPTVGAEVPIGSAFSSRGKSDPEFRRFCEFELELRVGLGHEILQDIRASSAIMREHQEEQNHTWGVNLTQVATRAQKKSASRKGRVASDYQQNWGRIQRLLDGWVPKDKHSDYLLGLQPLDTSKDMRYPRVSRQQATTYNSHSQEEVSWIWEVPMLGSATGSAARTPREALEEWADETRRLKWVHLFALTERWKEEVIRTREEIRRFAAFHSYKVAHHKQILASRAHNNTWVGRGRLAIQQALLDLWTSRESRLPQRIKDAIS